MTFITPKQYVERERERIYENFLWFYEQMADADGAKVKGSSDITAAVLALAQEMAIVADEIRDKES